MKQHSFRDPSGHLSLEDNHAIRIAHPEAWTQFQEIHSTIQLLQSEGLWIPSELIPLTEALTSFPEEIQRQFSSSGVQQAWKHPRIFFPSYSYEWCPGMLGAAGELTLEIGRRLLSVGWELKDASPSNVLFQGPRPIFIDHLSPSPIELDQLGWRAYGQFQRNFIIPLLLHKLNRIPLAWMTMRHRDGISPQDALPLLKIITRLRPSVLASITLPALFKDTKTTQAHNNKVYDRKTALIITQKLLNGLSRKLNRLSKNQEQSSTWSNYGEHPQSYSTDGKSQKENAIEELLSDLSPKYVLDLGCNTGLYTQKAARKGARCVAVDSDPVCIEQLWQRAYKENLDILPLIMDLGRPSPAMGWNYGEESSFLTRASGRFDLVMAFAIMHHLIVRERISLESFSKYLSILTTNWVLTEWIPPDDPHFIQIAGTNANLYNNLNQEDFENAMTIFFDIHTRVPISDSGRIIYCLKKREHQHTQFHIAK